MDFTLSVRLPADSVEALIKMAKDQQLSPEAVIRRAINYYRLISSGSHELIEVPRCTCVSPLLGPEKFNESITNCKAKKHMSWA